MRLQLGDKSLSLEESKDKLIEELDFLINF